MKAGGVGGANTQTGLVFEAKTDLADALRSRGYTIRGDGVFLGTERVGDLLQKSKLYSKFLAPRNVDASTIISRRLLPDEAIFSVKANLLTVIEKKWQQTEGSVDEKLQTCHFKKRQYQKLVAPTGARVQYFYVLNDWFRQPRYADVLEYIKEVGCDYFFESLPEDRLGLPTPPSSNVQVRRLDEP